MSGFSATLFWLLPGPGITRQSGVHVRVVLTFEQTGFNTPVTGQFFIAGTGVLFGLMLILALLVRRHGVRMGNRMLAASLACAMGYLLGLMLIKAGWSGGNGLVELLVSLYLLSPVFMLGYVRALTRPGFRLRRSDLLHLLPATIFFVMITLVSGENLASPEALEQARGGWPPNATVVVGLLLYLLQIVYLGRALFELQTYSRLLEWDFSYDKEITLKWLRVLLGISLLLASTGLLIALVRLIPGVELWPRSLYSMSAILVVYLVIGFIGMSQPAIFGPVADENPDSGTPSYGLAGNLPGVAPASAESNALPIEVESHYWSELLAYMEREKPFLERKLRIADLAARLDMPMHHLSQTINRRAEHSFSEFINRYRVDAAKELLKGTDKTISAITFDAGFSSESAFYRHFKKFTGQTPKQYRRKLHLQLSS